MPRLISIVPLFGSCLLTAALSFAAPRTHSALTLLEPPGARIAALGGAATALSNDVTAFGLNPSNLQSLETGQASFLYQKGLLDDSYGQLNIGRPGSNFGWGLSLGYYNTGTVHVFDGTNERDVVGQEDLVVGFGVARTFGPAALGLTGKYFYSEIGEAVSARTFLVEAGGRTDLHSRLSIGAAVQNVGGKLRYSAMNEDLPTLARAGLAWTVLPGAARTTLFTDGIYHLNMKELRPAIGVETLWGPLAFRTGYRSGTGLSEFTAGMGFLWGPSSLDYAFGLVDELDMSHRLSFSSRFGSGAASQAIVKQPTPKKPFAAPAQTSRPVFEAPRPHGFDPRTRIYAVKEGDTLKSIARAFYGSADMWDQIYRANQHLIEDPNTLTPGQKILLPEKTQ